jgi:hypothetical protein
VQRLCPLYRPDSYPAKITTNFRPNFKPENGKKKLPSRQGRSGYFYDRKMRREIQNPQMFETDPESFSQQSTLQNGVITQNNFLFKRLMAVSRLLYSIASYVHFKVGNNRASPFLFMEKMVDQILLNYANIMMMMGASMPKVIFYCCYTNLGHVFFKRKSRHWTYHFLFDILSYHIICRKNNIK